MKPLQLLATSILCLSPFIAFAITDPFAEQGPPEWQMESIEAKPYQLELAYGLHPSDSVEPNFAVKMTPDPEFFEQATKLSLSIAPEDTGEFQESGRHTVRYKVTENLDGSFDLNIYVQTLESGLREINSEVTLKLSDWVILGGLTQTNEDGTKQTYTTAIRIAPRTK